MPDDDRFELHSDWRTSATYRVRRAAPLLHGRGHRPPAGQRPPPARPMASA